MEFIVPILVQLAAGAAGGNVIGQLIKNLNLGTAGNSLVGAIGGLVATWLASNTPGLDTLVGAVSGASGTLGGLDMGALAGQAAVGLAGGGVLSALAAVLKTTMAKSQALR